MLFARFIASIYGLCGTLAANETANVFTNITTGVNTLKTGLLSIVGPMAIITLIVCGLIWFIPGLDDDKKKKAKTVLLSVVIGLAVIMLAPVIINTIKSVINPSANVGTASLT